MMVGIRNLRTEIKDAAAKTSLAIATMCQLLAAAGGEALAAGRVTLHAALFAIEEALVALGSR